MQKNFLNMIQNRYFQILIALSLLGAAIAGFLLKPFLLHFINTLAVIAAILFLIGIFMESWKKGDYANLTYFRHMTNEKSYRDYRRRLVTERKDIQNIFLYAAVLLGATAFILSVLENRL